jgi:transmembrane sensor
MTKELQDPVMEEARRWFVLLRDDEATKADLAEFAVWLHRSPAHRSAWERTERLWSRLDIIVPVIREQEAKATAPGWTDGDIRRSPGHAAQGLSRRAWMQRAAAAAIVAMVGGALLVPPDLFADYRTDIAERRSITLPDGSVAELGSATGLSVSFTDHARRITLHSGEAFFTVAQDPRRPLIVAAGKGETRALGTAFNVKRSGESVLVSVIEHAVAVSMKGHDPVTVSQGQQLRYGPQGLDVTEPANLAVVQAWRRDRLFFQEAPLHDVIADLERYRHGRIIITDERIGRIPVSGLFHTRQTDDALQTISDTLPVRVTKVTDLLVLVRPK